jgi:hypothetical protein
MLNKCSRSAHFCSLIMHIRISGFSAVFGIIRMQWLHHQYELGGDNGSLRFRVCSFRRMLPVKFLQQSSHRSHVLCAVNMKSQFDHYFIGGKVYMNKTCSKLNQNFKYSGPVEKVRFTFTKHSGINAGIFNRIQFKIFRTSIFPKP